MTDLHWLTLSEVCRRIKSGELTSRAVTEHALNRIRATDDRYRAYVTVTGNAAMARAERLDAARAKGEPLGPLHGVPIALKDLLWTRGVKTTCGTKVLANWVPDQDATVVTRLQQAGAVVLGKVKLTEGAFSDHHPRSIRHAMFGIRKCGRACRRRDPASRSRRGSRMARSAPTPAAASGFRRRPTASSASSRRMAASAGTARSPLQTRWIISVR